MKKTISINLNGIAFNIDEDAYGVLEQYISEINADYNRNQNIEENLAELFSEKLRDENKNVIEINHVNSIVNALGKENIKQENNNNNIKKPSKRFYRDPDNKIMGGVAAGLAAYLGWNLTLIRILIILTVIFGFGWSIAFYIVVWIIAPEARTAAQKSEMLGEDLTIENIKSKFNNDCIEIDKTNSIGKTIGNIFMSIFKVILIILGCFIGFIGLIILGALITAAVIIIANHALLLDFLPFTVLPTYLKTIIGISTLLTFLCPLIVLVDMIIRIIRHKNNSRTKWFRLTLLIIWLLSIITLVVIGVSNMDSLHEFFIP